MTASTPAKEAPAPAAAEGHHASATAVRRRVVRRCKIVRVRTTAGKVVRRKRCRRVVIRVRVPNPVPPTGTAAGTTTAAVPVTPPPPPGTTTSDTTPGGTTTGGTTTACPTAGAPGPVLGTISVDEFGTAANLQLTLSTRTVPAGTYVIQRVNATAIPHSLDVRPTCGSVPAVFFSAATNVNQKQTVVLTPGEWTFRCTVLGHGTMIESLKVTA